MNRTTLNATIDAAAYAGIVLLATTGLLLRIQLPPGSGGLHGMGSGAAAAAREVGLVWGLSRHEWGTVHYWIALGVMAVLAVHLALHWKWIDCVLRGKPRSAYSGRRLAVGLASLVLIALLASVPLLTPVQSTQRQKTAEDFRDRGIATDAEDVQTTPVDAESIRGSMTFSEVAAQTGLPISAILERAGLPPETSPSQQVGRALRLRGLEMPDFREAIRKEEAKE